MGPECLVNKVSLSITRKQADSQAKQPERRRDRQSARQLDCATKLMQITTSSNASIEICFCRGSVLIGIGPVRKTGNSWRIGKSSIGGSLEVYLESELEDHRLHQ